MERLVGESVPEEERILVKDSSGDSLLNASSSTHNLPLVMATGPAAAVSDVERAAWQQEKEKLYQMLDEKVHHDGNAHSLDLNSLTPIVAIWIQL